MYAVTVAITLQEGRAGAFLPMMQENAVASLRTETGCRRFDVCTDPERPDEVFLYELYDDAAAFRLHLDSAHFSAFDSGTREMIAEKIVRTFAEVHS